jgi:hypothetical protein
VQEIESALSHQKIQGLFLLCFENERPPRGALGYFDWLFAGHFTSLLKNQVLTGKKGDVLYTPILWNGSTLHFLVMGGGYLDDDGTRPAFDEKLLNQALTRAEGLRLENLGIVSGDWNFTGNEKQITELEKRKICVLN